MTYEKNMIILSAKSREQLKEMAGNLLDKLSDISTQAFYNITNIAYTLQTGRDELEERLVFISDSINELEQEIRAYLEDEESTNRLEGRIDGKMEEEEALDFGPGVDIRQIAGQWIKGRKIIWKSRYIDKQVRKISLPGYVFIRKPLLIQKEAQEGCLLKKIFTQNINFLKDHIANGKIVFPGAAYLDLIMEALKPFYPDMNYQLSNIKFLSMLEIGHDPAELRVILRRKDNKQLLEVVSEVNPKLTVTHLEAALHPRFQTGNIEEKLVRQVLESGFYYSGAKVYKNYERLGLQYGQSFRGISRLFVKENEAVAELLPSFSEPEEWQDYVIYPGLLDSALQSIMGLNMETDKKVMLPYYIKSFIPPCGGADWSYIYVKRNGNKTGQYDITVLNSQFDIICRIEGFLVREIEKESRENTGYTLLGGLKEITCQLLELTKEEIDIDTELGNYGFDSLSYTSLCDRINEKYKLNISPAILFEYPTLKDLAAYLSANLMHENPDKMIKEEQKAPVDKLEADKEYRNDVAIIGIAGKMPMSEDLSHYFEQLMQGKDFITEIPEERWDWREYYGDSVKGKNKTLAKWGGFVDGIEYFDAPFFKISNYEAQLMDPQQRIMLELAWNVVEDAGYSMLKLSNSNTGVIIGVASNSEYNDLLNSNMEETEVYQSTGVAASVLTNRISYMFNWHGLSEPVDTACSSSLTAIHRAVIAIKSGECDLAAAGGTNLILTPKGAISFGKAGMLSEDGQCKTFSADANGYVRSEGMGLVLLKPLSKAMQDGDNIYAVIRGTAVNHGGKGNSITSPNPNAQAQVIVDAMKRADVDFSMVNFVELHGTGTSIGDVIEINGLKKAYRKLPGQEKKEKIALTSVKANVGHLETAAGMASLFKVLYIFKRHQLPRQINIEKINPNIDFEECPFFISQDGVEFGDKRLIAGISSFGFGGANSHMVLEEYQDDNPFTEKKSSKMHQKEFSILLSARNEEALKKRGDLLLKALPDCLKDERDNKLIILISEILHITENQISRELLLKDMGFDGLTLEKLKNRIYEELKIELPYQSMMVMETVGQLITLVREAEGTQEAVPGYGEKWQDEERYMTELEYTLLTGRNHMEKRAAFLVNDLQDLKKQLADFVYRNEIRITGKEIDFNVFSRNEKIKRLNLPGYPFASIPYWFDDAKDKPGLVILDSGREGYQYCVSFNSMYDLFCGHVIENKVLLPGAFSIELLNDIGRKIFGNDNKIIIEELYWITPFELIEGKEQILYISVEKRERTRIKAVSFEVNEKITHIQAEIVENSNYLSAEAQNNPPILHMETGEDIDITALYNLYNEKHFAYGKAYQTIKKLVISKNEVFGILKSDDLGNWDAKWHPAIIDGAFQAVAGMNFSGGSEKAFLPFLAKSVKILEPLTDTCHVYIREIGAELDKKRYSILITDPEGNLLVHFNEFVVKEFAREKKEGDSYCLTSQFVPKKLTPVNDLKEECYHIVLGELEAGFAGVDIEWIKPEDMENRIIRNKTRDKQPIKIIIALGRQKEDDLDLNFYHCFRFIRAMLHKFYALNFMFGFVYLNNELEYANKALAGFLRTVCMENSHYKIKLIGVEDYQVKELYRELTDVNQYFEEIRYSGKKRYSKELVEITDVNKRPEKNLRQRGTYLLVGGNGGVGYVLAEYLIKQYDANVVILSRSQDKDSRYEELSKSESKRVAFYIGDIGDINSARQGFQKIRENHEIHGVFHLAGSLNDGFILTKKEEQIKGVLEPKTLGIWNLDYLTKDYKLDLFCTFSSVTAINGNPGQADYAYANSFMDEFISERKNMELKGLRHGKSITINWPFWENGGMAMDQGIRKQHYEQYGVIPLDTKVGLNLLEYAIKSQYSNIAVFYGIKKKIKEALLALKFDINSEEREISDMEGKTGEVYVQNQLESLKEKLRNIFSDILKADVAAIDTSENLEMYGFNSLMMMSALDRIESMIGEACLNPSIVNDYKTIDGIAGYIAKSTGYLKNSAVNVAQIDENEIAMKKPYTPGMEGKIAVIGIACRFPHAKNQDEYFDNLLTGRNLIVDVPIERWDAKQYYSPEQDGKDTTVSKWGSFLQDIDLFDADYFGLSDIDALVMDPQQRLMLELSVELLCNAGYEKEEISGKKIGVFIGASESTYVKDRLHHIGQDGMKNVVVGTIQNMIASRISDYLNLKGSAFVVDTACSSSLVSIDEACRHLLDGSLSMAVAGGIQLLLDPVIHIGLSQAGVLTGEKKAYVFDERAKGIVLGEGAGLVLLKRLEQAIMDGDRIQAVILGTATNNDGHTMGLTTPDMESQKEVIQEAISKSGISPATISYYEAHGTGTLLGDPIEIKAATQVYRQYSQECGICAVGSVKANMGHLLRAAGIASFIKVVMSMQNEMIVKTINCENPHPRFHFPESPFYPSPINQQWVGLGGYRRAAISSFGFGGTNCHMILEDYKDENPQKRVRYAKAAPLFNKKTYWLGKKMPESYLRFIKSANPYITDHKVYNKPIMLGVTYCGAGIEQAIMNYSDDRMIRLSKFLFHAPLVFEKEDTAKITIKKKEETGQYFVEVKLISEDKSFEAASYILKEVIEDIDKEPKFCAESFQKESGQIILKEQIYSKMKTVQVDFGPSLRTVEKAWVKGEEVLCELKNHLPEEEYNGISPVFLDGAIVGSLSPFTIKEEKPFIPIMIHELIYYGQKRAVKYSHSRLKKMNSQIVVLDIILYDEDGISLVKMSDLTLKKAEKINSYPVEEAYHAIGESVHATGEPVHITKVSAHATEEPAYTAEEYLKNIISKEIKTNSADIDYSRNFLEMGLNSKQLISMVEEIEKDLGLELYPTFFFEYQNIDEAGVYLSERAGDRFNNAKEVMLKEAEKPEKKIEEKPEKDIAIIGMQGKFSESDDLNIFWDNLIKGNDLIEEIPLDHFDYRPWFSEDMHAPDMTYSKWGSFIRDVDKFDADFFHIAPGEAEAMDPQLRLLLQVIYSTAEDAGVIKTIRGTKTGVYVGACFQDYSSEMGKTGKAVEPYDGSGNAQTMYANRPSFFFDLKGPSLAVDTACSSSLVAIHLACKALQNGECEMAFAAGVNLLLSSWHYRYFSSIQALSPKGRCHTFDEKADGYVPGEGIAAILLKPLNAAVRDGDRIHCVIKGSAVNHGGYTPSITAPSMKLEARVVMDAWENAGIRPETLGYIEAHGTGTKLGDPIEINALKEAFANYTNKEQFCAIGSAKAHIGHTEGTAGIAGVIKAALSLENKMIPAMPAFQKLNPFINLEHSPLYINQEPIKWESEASQPRRAGISSFGFGGTYSHLVLEEYEHEKFVQEILEENIIVISAKTKTSLKMQAKALIEYLGKAKGINIRDIASTLAYAREVYEIRVAFVADSIDILIRKLELFVKNENYPEIYNTSNVKREMEYGESHIDNAYENKDLDILAKAWAQGGEVPLHKVIKRLPVISLPGYQFDVSRYWVLDKYPVNLNYLLDSGEATLKGQRFRKIFTKSEPYLADHQVKGYHVLPGVISLEMAHMAGTYFDGRRGFEIHDFSWDTPLMIFSGQLEVFTELSNAENYVGIDIYSQTNLKKIDYAKGKLIFVNKIEEMPLSNINIIEQIKQCAAKVYMDEECYQMLSKQGLSIGPALKAMKKLYVDGERLCVELESYFDRDKDFLVSPSLLDAAIQAIIGFSLETDEILHVPCFLKRITYSRKLFKKGYAVLSLHPGSKRENREKVVDITLYDEWGNEAVEMENLVLKPFINQPASLNEKEIKFYKKAWKKSSGTAVEKSDLQTCMIYNSTPDSSLFARVKASIEGSVANILEIDGPEALQFSEAKSIKLIFTDEYGGEGIYSANGKRAIDSFIQMLRFIQIILQGKKELSIYYITDLSLHQGMEAFLKSAVQEEDRLNFQMINNAYQASASNLAEEILMLPENLAIRYENIERYSLSVEETAQSQGNGLFGDNKVYIIPGGMGKLGGKMAAYLIKKYHSKVILLGTRDFTHDREQLLRELNQEAKDGQAEYIKCDVTKYEAVLEVIGDIRKRYGRIDGILYLAGSLDDSLIRNKNVENAEYTAKVKLSGAIHLDMATRNDSLDFFICFSSIVTVNGNPGQTDYAYANGCLNTFVSARNLLTGQGRAYGNTWSICWPVWEDGGMKMPRQAMDKIHSRYGIEAISFEEGMKLLEGITREDELVIPIKQNLSQNTNIPMKKEKQGFAATKLEQGQLEKDLTLMLSTILKIDINKIKPDKKMTDYGLESISITQFAKELSDKYQIEVRPAVFYELDSIKDLAKYLDKFNLKAFIEERTLEERKGEPIAPVEHKSEPIAIIGIAGVMPGCQNLDQFWQALSKENDLISIVPPSRWDWQQYYGNPKEETGKTLCNKAGFVDNIDEFDPEFFSISAREAESMDPQQRLYLKIVWECIENAGYKASDLSGSKTGVFVGVGNFDYSDLMKEYGISIDSYSSTGIAHSILANRISYLLNFKGISQPVDTACSSSLVAIHHAIQAIENGYCDMAIAGGVNLMLTPNMTIAFSKAGMLSEDCKCKAFDEGADGYVRGEGAGAILLKPLKKAVGDGDYIHALVLGGSVNHGGRAHSLTAPNPAAQATVIKDAFSRSGIRPDTVTYIEAHGTGTSLGDPVEIEGLCRAFQGDSGNVFDKDIPFCGVGSVKTNIGHLETAAGIAGILKVVLAMKHMELPANLHFTKCNSHISLNNTPFYIVDHSMPWKRRTDMGNQVISRRAGVSSFGFGGVNAHIVLEEYDNTTRMS
ncbi:MAG: SDR family NAD(P)-dependent oxidoreductase, partial [Lachnospiraceae bacterium]|nr:SDR family NAD(P)-dependent oxidoreductase [Lachnospiraceae bacterium]